MFNNHYKAGSRLFRTLSEGRMQIQHLLNQIRYSYPAPNKLVQIDDVDIDHKKIGSSQSVTINAVEVHPQIAGAILNKKTEITFPPKFIAEIENGRVLGDGSVILPNNSLLSESTTDFHRKQEFHALLSAKKIPSPMKFEGKLAVITSPGSSNYFHWTLDSIPRLSLLKNMDAEIDAYLINTKSGFQKEWLKWLGIPSSKIIQAHPNQHMEANKLIVPSFCGVAGLPDSDGINFIKSFNQLNEKPFRKIYISRSNARRRKIVNEKEILPILKRHNFEIVHPGEISVQKQMEIFSTATIVVAAHGAELTNLVFCQPNTKIIEILSPYYINPCFKNIATVCNLNYQAIIGKGGKRVLQKKLDAHHVWANIKISPYRFECQLKEVLSQ